MAATEAVASSLEIVDSRIANWRTAVMGHPAAAVAWLADAWPIRHRHRGRRVRHARFVHHCSCTGTPTQWSFDQSRRCRCGSRRGVGLGQLVEVGQRPPADLRGLVGRQAEQPQHVFGHAVGGLGVVAIGLVVQQIAEPQQRAAGDRQRELGIVDREPACAAPRRRCRAAPAAPGRGRTEISANPLASRIRLSCGRRRNSRPVSRKLRANVSAGSSSDRR